MEGPTEVLLSVWGMDMTVEEKSWVRSPTDCWSQGEINRGSGGGAGLAEIGGWKTSREGRLRGGLPVALTAGGMSEVSRRARRFQTGSKAESREQVSKASS